MSRRVGFGFISDVLLSRSGAARGWCNRTSTPHVDVLGHATASGGWNSTASRGGTTRFRAVYDDARSIELKAGLAKRAGLRGMSMWTASALNYNDTEASTGMWAALAS